MTLVTQTMSETSSDSGSSPSVSSVRMTASWPSQVSGVTITHTQERVHAHWPVVDRAFTAWLGCGWAWALTLVIPLVWPRGCTEIHRLWAVSVPGWSCPHTRAPLVTADHSHPVCDGPQHTHTHLSYFPAKNFWPLEAVTLAKFQPPSVSSYPQIFFSQTNEMFSDVKSCYGPNEIWYVETSRVLANTFMAIKRK